MYLTVVSMIFPWQIHAWQQITSRPLPHAFLIYGRRGIGKLHFAKSLAQALLCEQPGSNLNPCESCPSCHWFRQESHPDFKLLQPEALEADPSDEGANSDTGAGKTKRGGSQISVGQVRTLSGFLELSAHRQGRKVVLLHPADELNVNAANALLKTLEEPPQDTVLLLLTHRVHRILPTVRSRCRALPMRCPLPAESIDWLAAHGVESAAEVLSEAGFAPLRALEYMHGDYRERRKRFLDSLAAQTHDLLGLAASQEGRDLPQILGWLQKWIYDLLSMRLTGRIRYNSEYAVALRQLASRIDAASLVQLYRVLVVHESRLGHPLNARLALERLLLTYQHCAEGGYR